MPPDPKRGEIWRVDLEPVRGAEIRKTRPAIVVSSNAVGKLPLRIVVPFTEWKDRYQQADWMVKVEVSKENGLSKTSAADAFQTRSLDTGRFTEKMGVVSDISINEVIAAIAHAIEFNPTLSD